MSQHFLTTREAAKRLGFAVSTLYSWLAQSDSGTFYLQGEQITIEYSQTGAKGQGHIRIAAQEVERLKQAMQVPPVHHGSGDHRGRSSSSPESRCRWADRTIDR